MDNVCSFNYSPFFTTDIRHLLPGSGRDSVGQRRAFQIYTTGATARPLSIWPKTNLATGIWLQIQADIIQAFTS
jgi:hypothetical protein